MVRRLTFLLVLAVAAATSAPAWAQAPLSVADAVARARARNPEARAAAVLVGEAEARVAQARAGFLPRVDVFESWQRGNQPVFVFSSLLSQRRFEAADFALDALNHPDATTNFRAGVSIEQLLFNPAARAAPTAARAERDSAALARTQADRDLAVTVTAAYGRVLLASARAQAAAAAVAAAGADRARAAARRDAGLVTDADVLQLDMHLSRARASEIEARADERIARADLNAVMGEPLDGEFALAPLGPEIDEPLDLAVLETEAVAARTEVQAAVQYERMAEAAQASARAAFLPQVSAHGGWEVNGGEFQTRASSWIAGVTARVNVFNGFADRARLAEARALAGRRAIDRERIETAVRFDVRTAAARVASARARIETARAALAQAREARRIIRDRYDNGLAGVADLLGAARSEEEAATARLSAEIDLAVAAASLHRALGRP